MCVSLFLPGRSAGCAGDAPVDVDEGLHLSLHLGHANNALGVQVGVEAGCRLDDGLREDDNLLDHLDDEADLWRLFSALAAEGSARRDSRFMSTPTPASTLCPCGFNKEHADCCGPILAGVPALTAEALMRSRYSAYAKRNYKHLEDSLCAEQRADFSLQDARTWAESSEWLGLEVLDTTGGGEADSEGTVRFLARFRTDGEAREHLENARFIREDGLWVYAGQVTEKSTTVRRAEPKIGRNDACPCGSGKKYKKCHGAAG